MLFPVDNLQGTILFIRGEGTVSGAMAAVRPGSIIYSTEIFYALSFSPNNDAWQGQL